MAPLARRHLLARLSALASASVACNQLAGIDEPDDRIPAVLADWAPRSADLRARITSIAATGDRIYVGLSNGEIFFRARADGATGPPWTPVTQPASCSARMPIAPVTAIAVTEQVMFVGYAGVQLGSQLWSVRPGGCWEGLTGSEVLALSLSPFDSSRVFVATRRGTGLLDAQGTIWPPMDPSINFDRQIFAVAEGRSDDGARRIWAGDDQGQLHFTDDIDAGVPRQSMTWRGVDGGPFPLAGAVAIAVDPDVPSRIWITSLSEVRESLWLSIDNGRTWRNGQGPLLPAPEGPPADRGGAPLDPDLAFTAVSYVPGLDLAIVTALLRGPDRKSAASPFWSEKDARTWWLQ
jgi:hypothetical protein